MDLLLTVLCGVSGDDFQEGGMVHNLFQQCFVQVGYLLCLLCSYLSTCRHKNV